jgi:2-C-methyl-D-erythritol 2,4-cyclodiphosphate synthase
MDSMLGALALGDIGIFFPDTLNKYKNINSLLLLEEINNIIKKKNYEIVNIDSIIVCQKPKLKDYIFKMRENISSVLNINIENISIKATTEEKLGFTGNLEGISSHAISLLKKVI